MRARPGTSGRGDYAVGFLSYKTRHAVVCGLAADATGIGAAILLSYLFFALCAHFGDMGCATVILSIWKPKLESTCLEPLPFENGGRLYRRFGVMQF